jgi:3-deoxy-manno-octulosonate cytidylyltransferase (CMP-KDO synthetase)
MSDKNESPSLTGTAAQASIHVIIPARFGSERLPGKPLCDIGGKPLVAHVAERALEANVGPVWVATDDKRVLEACLRLGLQAMMTSGEHRSGTERIAEVCDVMQLDDAAVVINLQGDEPLMPAALIREVGTVLVETAADMATLSHRIECPAELMSSNVVKVVRNQDGRALYFSRAPIPWHRASLPDAPERAVKAFAYQRHIGVYAYSVAFLRLYVGWPEAPAEALERLEQLRALHHGAHVQVKETSLIPGPGVDTAAELARVRELMQQP